MSNQSSNVTDDLAEAAAARQALQQAKDYLQTASSNDMRDAARADQLCKGLLRQLQVYMNHPNLLLLYARESETAEVKENGTEMTWAVLESGANAMDSIQEKLEIPVQLVFVPVPAPQRSGQPQMDAQSTLADNRLSLAILGNEMLATTSELLSLYKELVFCDDSELLDYGLDDENDYHDFHVTQSSFQESPTFCQVIDSNWFEREMVPSKRSSINTTAQHTEFTAKLRSQGAMTMTEQVQLISTPEYQPFLASRDWTDEIMKWYDNAAQPDVNESSSTGKRCRALSWFRNSMKRGAVQAPVEWLMHVTQSCYNWLRLGLMLATEIHAHNDTLDARGLEGEAFEWLKIAAEQGSVKAQVITGFCYETGRLTACNLELAIKWYLQAADQGAANAQLALGLLYSRGLHRDQLASKSFDLFRSASKKMKEASFGLGQCYAQGFGVQADPKEAAQFYKQAAEQGHVPAQVELGHCFRLGLGVERNDDKALEYYCKAADGGDPIAMYDAAVHYSSELGEATAFEWIHKAAKKGLALAQLRMGELLESRKVPVPQDLLGDPLYWYRKAARQGNQQAKRIIEKRETQLSSNDVEAASSNASEPASLTETLSVKRKRDDSQGE